MWQFIPLVASAVSSGLSAVGSVRQARAYRREGARLADDILQKGEFDATRAERDLATILGAQRASFGSAMIDPTFGSAAQIAEETETIGLADVAQIRENAMREAAAVRRGARIQAQGATIQAFGDGLSAFGTLGRLGANAWDAWSRNRGMNAPSLMRTMPTNSLTLPPGLS